MSVPTEEAGSQSSASHRDARAEAKRRLLQTFTFLNELAALRNPVQRTLDDYSDVFRLDSWPLHPRITIRRGDATGSEEENQDTTGKDIDPVIRITRAARTRCPTPPPVLQGWLKPGWESIDDEPTVLEAQNVTERGGHTATLRFTDDDERVIAFDNWVAARSHWVDAERPAVEARRLFERVYGLWTRMQRDGDRLELVLADGLLCVDEHHLRHPILLQRLTLEFDPTGPEFRFFAGVEKTELQRALLRLVPTIEAKMIARFDDQLETEPVDPLGGERTEGFLKRLVQGLFKNGEFLHAEPSGTTDRPCLWRAPAVFLRPRTAGLSATLDHIIEDLRDETSEVPEGLGRIVGVEMEAARPDSTVIDVGGNLPPALGQPADILFSKPANAEQREIAARLETTKSVVVQGPPGTGKTHTIANLLGHLLSEGRTVLVTAHTTKALRVLREKVDAALQPLCLSVLEGDSKSQGQLSHAAQEIAHRLSVSDPRSLRREAAAFRTHRKKLLSRTKNLQRQLRDARFSEIDEIVVSGDGLEPIAAAKRVKTGAQTDAWIPGPVEPGVLCPLADSEVRDLYALQGVLTRGDETQLAIAQPILARIVTPPDFRLLADQQASEKARAQAHRPEFWDEKPAADYTPADLQRLHQEVRDAAAFLDEEAEWLREALYAGWRGGDLSATWQDLIGVMENLSSQAEAAHRLMVEHGPALPPDQPVREVVGILREIVQFTEHGGTLGRWTRITKPKWRRLIDRCSVNEGVPRTQDEFRALLADAQLRQSREHFLARWGRLVETLGGPGVDALRSAPERIARGFAPEIRKRLEWRANVWTPLEAKLREVGFHWHEWLESHPPTGGHHGDLDRLRSAVSDGLANTVGAQTALLRQVELTAALQEQRTYLAGFPQSAVASELQRAQDEWDVDTYEESYRELARLHGMQPVYDKRLALLTRLETTAPTWARAIARRTTPHDGTTPPSAPANAWLWRQWQQELEKRASTSMDELQDKLDAVDRELQQLSARIIDSETWAAQCERTGLKQKQALLGFVQTMRKVGKRAPARALPNYCAAQGNFSHLHAAPYRCGLCR